METGKIINLAALVIFSLYTVVGFYVGVIKHFWTSRRLRYFHLPGSALLAYIVSSAYYFKESLSVPMRLLAGSAAFLVILALLYLLERRTIRILSNEPFRSKYHIHDDEDAMAK